MFYFPCTFPGKLLKYSKRLAGRNSLHVQVGGGGEVGRLVKLWENKHTTRDLRDAPSEGRRRNIYKANYVYPGE